MFIDNVQVHTYTYARVKCDCCSARKKLRFIPRLVVSLSLFPAITPDADRGQEEKCLAAARSDSGLG